MTELGGGLAIDPCAPTLYVGFSGVLHRGEGMMDTHGRVTLNSGLLLRRARTVSIFAACTDNELDAVVRRRRHNRVVA
jgi:hypothetical protein